MTLDYDNIINQIDALLEKKEWREVEFKSAKGGFPGSFWDTYSAFANTEGGVIVLGVKEKDDEFYADGLTEEQIRKYQKDFWNAVNSPTTVNRNVLMNDDVHPFKCGDAHLLVFRIPQCERSQKPIYRTQNPYNGTFKRNHEGDYKCTEEEVRRMFADANVSTPADSRILPNFTMDDIDAASLAQYRRLFAVSKPEHPWLALDDIELLTKLGGYRKDRDTKQEGLTLAGLLMFGKTESITDNACAPHFFVDYRLYSSEKSTGTIRWTDRICPDGEWEANLFQFYRRVLPKLTSTLPKPFVLDEDTRIDETTAHIALREALMNLCIHTDYSINASLTICQYPNRIEMSNPGTLLVSRAQYYKGGESICRNTSLQKMFTMLGKAEKAGSGVDKILQGWRDKNWKKPLIETNCRPDKVNLYLYMESVLPDEVRLALEEKCGKVCLEMGYDKITAMSVAYTEGEVTNERLQFMLNLHRTDITLMLKQLCSDGMLESEGYGRWTKYKIKGRSLATSDGSIVTSDGSIVTSDEKYAQFNDGSMHSSNTSMHSSDEKYVQFDGGSVHSLGRSLATSGESLATSKKRLSKHDAYITILEYCEFYRTSSQIARKIGKNETYLKTQYLKPMENEKLIEKLFPNIPNHPRQQYIRTANGEAFLQENNKSNENHG